MHFPRAPFLAIASDHEKLNVYLKNELHSTVCEQSSTPPHWFNKTTVVLRGLQSYRQRYFSTQWSNFVVESLDFASFLPQYQPRNSRVIHVWELSKALRDTLTRAALSILLPITTNWPIRLQHFCQLGKNYLVNFNLILLTYSLSTDASWRSVSAFSVPTER